MMRKRFGVEDGNILLRAACLGLLTIQTSALILVMRSSLVSDSNYIPASVVVTVEIAKLLLSLIMEILTRPDKSATMMLYNLRMDLQQNYRAVLKLAVPAILYAVQNNLSYFALARLSAVTFQVLQQLRIPTTALMAVLLMDKQLTIRHWSALFLLTAGVACVQLASVSESNQEAKGEASSAWMGFAALLINSASSGFAGIYFERLVKGTAPKPPRRTISQLRMPLPRERSVWLQSMELGFFGLLFSLILALVGESGATIRRLGFFYGYDSMTWLVVGMQATGGMLVAMVIRYADSLLKAFATAASIVLSGVITFGIMGHQLSIEFVLGVSLVAGAVYLYAAADRAQLAIKKV
jgi:UDP-sugar transporter A1/2/3